jgi:hypothetical protein
MPQLPEQQILVVVVVVVEIRPAQQVAQESLLFAIMALNEPLAEQ